MYTSARIQSWNEKQFRLGSMGGTLNDRGIFVYDERIGMYHRVHEGSETSACIADNVRIQEDLAMLEKFWPKPIARLINKMYKFAQTLNG